MNGGGYSEEGGPQQTSMAVRRRKTRRVINARVSPALYRESISKYYLE